jgi:hypothetical protein
MLSIVAYRSGGRTIISTCWSPKSESLTANCMFETKHLLESHGNIDIGVTSFQHSGFAKYTEHGFKADSNA